MARARWNSEFCILGKRELFWYDWPESLHLESRLNYLLIIGLAMSHARNIIGFGICIDTSASIQLLHRIIIDA